MKSSKSILKTTLLTGAMLLAAISPTVHAAGYYVDANTGNNSNNCTSLTTACKTITAAINKAASGDMIVVEDGVYNEQVVFPANKNNLTVRASKLRWPYPIIDGGVPGGSYLPVGDWQALVDIRGNYNTFQGFEVRNSNLVKDPISGKYTSGGKYTNGGFGVQASGHHNTIDRVKVHDTWSTGVFLQGDYNEAYNSEIYFTNGMTSLSASSPGWQNVLWNAWPEHTPKIGPTVKRGWGQGASCADGTSAAVKPGVSTGCKFIGNIVHSNWSEGFGCFNADGCVVEDNVMYDNYTQNFYWSDATNGIAQRNIVARFPNPVTIKDPILTGGTNFTLADERSDKPRSSNNRFINNLIFGDVTLQNWSIPTDGGLKNVLFAHNTIIDGCFRAGLQRGGNVNSIIENNVFFNNCSDYNATSGITFSNNYWKSRPANAAGAGDVLSGINLLRLGTAAPGLLTKEYFKVGAGSTTIGAAITEPKVLEDAWGTVRGAPSDIGAYEYAP